MVGEKKISEGYKETEVGIIPKEWEINSIEELIKQDIIEKPLDGNHGNLHPKSGDYVNTGIPFVMANNVINGKVDLLNCNFIRESQASKLRKGFSIAGDVLLTHKGTIGNTAIVPKIKTDYIMLTPQVTYYRVKNHEKIYNKFIRSYFDSAKFKQKLNEMSGGGTRAYIGIVKQQKLPFVLPGIEEQKAIATALSDIDDLTSSLEKLIYKKKLIKQGAMQKLLTGKKRLDGFDGKWNIKKIMDVSTTFSGGTPLTSVSRYYGGNIKWITSTDLNKPRIKSVIGRITEEGLKNSSSKMIKKGTLLLALYGATAGITSISQIDAAINQAVLAINTSDEISNEFLFYWLTLKKDWIIKTFTQGGQPNLSGDIIKNIEVDFPQDYSEQIAIAKILSDMDSEIEKLQLKLNKYKNIKRGMMEELLTGKRRLI